MVFRVQYFGNSQIKSKKDFLKTFAEVTKQSHFDNLSEKDRKFETPKFSRCLRNFCRCISESLISSTCCVISENTSRKNKARTTFRFQSPRFGSYPKILKKRIFSNTCNKFSYRQAGRGYKKGENFEKTLNLP